MDTLELSSGRRSAGGPCPSRCSESGAGHCRRAERGRAGGQRGCRAERGRHGEQPLRELPAQVQSGAPGLRWLPAPRPSPPLSRDGLFGREGGRGLPFLREVPSLARETFYVPVRERQLVAVTEVRGVFGFSRTSLLLHLQPPPHSPSAPNFPSRFAPSCSLFVCGERGGGDDLQGGCSVLARGTVQKGSLGSDKVRE